MMGFTITITSPWLLVLFLAECITLALVMLEGLIASATGVSLMRSVPLWARALLLAWMLLGWAVVILWRNG